ncbi:MAG: hypothetical protein ACJ8FY_15250 [Gemmataceae bacterium]
MAKQSLCRASNGLFVRNLGYKQGPKGFAQPKFYLGRDPRKANLANLRLEQLWYQVKKRWQRENETPVFDEDRQEWIRHRESEQPVWDTVTLTIAEAIIKGETVAHIEPPANLMELAEDAEVMTSWLQDIQSDFPIIKLELADKELQRRGDETWQSRGRELIEAGRNLLKANTAQTFYQALDAYCVWIEQTFLTVEKQLTLWGKAQLGQVAFRCLADLPLNDLDSTQIEQIINTLRLRPMREDGKPVSQEWTKNVLKRVRHFLRWLNKNPDFDWRKPTDLEYGQVRIPTTPQEKASRIKPAQVTTYSLEELQTLWENATSFQRLLMLLALNCGFGRAEIASLVVSEIFLHEKHPHERLLGISSSDSDCWIRRLRHKSSVYGEWRLWPETVNAIKWWHGYRSTLPVPSEETALLVTRRGGGLYRTTKGNNANGRIPNCWASLTKRVRKHYPNFRTLSFNKLRKTAGNLIRQEAGGEIASVFLCHGSSVKDELLDVYTNRPFSLVFQAGDRVGERLRPLFAKIEHPFSDAVKLGGSNISQGKIRRIQSLKRQGYKTGQIAEVAGVTRETVRRWAKASNLPKGQADR